MSDDKYNASLKEQALKEWLVDKVHWKVVSDKYNCTRVSLWRWKTKYDGTIESLQNKSSKPLTLHPTAQTSEEKKLIETVLDDNPIWSYTELFDELRDKHGYSRHYLTMYKFIKKLEADRKAEKIVATENKVDPTDEINKGILALTDLFNSIKTNPPIIVEQIVKDIDGIVKIVRFDGWQETTAGKQEVKKALRSVVWNKYKIKDIDVFGKTYKYIELYY
jgi:hypothetical protein